MDPEQDPFALFENKNHPEIGDIDKPRKKVHLDPMLKLESAIIANKFNDERNNLI